MNKSNDNTSEIVDDLNSVTEEEELTFSANESREIVWQTKDFSIREFHTMWQEGDLNLQPKYQRKYVSTPKIASKLIESILMDVPIPVIYLDEEDDGSYGVIDGQQRLTSFISFINGYYPRGNIFKLLGLKVLKELNKKQFSELDKKFQNKIKKATIHTIIIKKESNADIKFEIFERLNTGSIKLNEDEIRNTIYRGTYINLLDELEDNKIFHELVQKENFKRRMIYRGMILRFLALSEKSYLNYVPSMKQFCNKELREHRSLSEEKTREYKKRFAHCIDLVKTVFGASAFRRYIPIEESKKKKGYYSTSRINLALFDIQMCGFVNKEKSDVLRNADFIREAMLGLMIKDKTFIDSILTQTSNKKMVGKRFKIWFDKLDEIIKDSHYQKRTFSRQLKEELFRENPVCAISNQKILSIDDCEVDHKNPYSKGGKTDRENAQLVFRHFNRSKKDNENFILD